MTLQDMFGLSMLGLITFKMTGNGVNAELLSAKDFKKWKFIHEPSSNSDNNYMSYYWLGNDRWTEYSFDMPEVGNTTSCFYGLFR